MIMSVSVKQEKEKEKQNSFHLKKKEKQSSRWHCTPPPLLLRYSCHCVRRSACLTAPRSSPPRPPFRLPDGASELGARVAAAARLA